MTTSVAPSLLDRVVVAHGDVRPIGLMRAAFGLIVIRHFWPDLSASTVPVERFHVPWWSWLPTPAPGLYRALVIVGVVAGAAMVVGLFSRLATATAFAIVTYLLFVDMTGFAHNRGFLVWMLAGLTFLPTDRAFSLDARLGRAAPPIGALWPVFVLRVVVSTVYLTSGLTKLANPDWRDGLVLWDRVNRYAHKIPFDGWVFDVVTSRWFHRVLAPSAIAVEVFIALALWNRRTRAVAMVVAVIFHASIEITASVQTFSYSAIAALLIWLVPLELRGRAPSPSASAPAASARPSASGE